MVYYSMQKEKKYSEKKTEKRIYIPVQDTSDWQNMELL